MNGNLLFPGGIEDPPRPSRQVQAVASNCRPAGSPPNAGITGTQNGIAPASRNACRMYRYQNTSINGRMTYLMVEMQRTVGRNEW